MTPDQQVSVEVPSEFICPITLAIMQYPIASRHGHNYEREAIVEWLASSSGETCPLTRKPLKLSDLIHNRVLSAEIRRWRKAYGIHVSGQWDEMQCDGSDVMHQMYGTNVVGKLSTEAPIASLQRAELGSPTSVRTPFRAWPIGSPRKLLLPRLKRRLSQTETTAP